MGWHNEVGPGERETGGANRGEKKKGKVGEGKYEPSGEVKERALSENINRYCIPWVCAHCAGENRFLGECELANALDM